MVPPPSKGAAAASTLNVADAGAAAEAAEDTVGCATTTNDDHGDADEQPSFRTNPGQQDDDAGSSASNDDDESDEDESEEDDADGPPAPPLSLAEIREWKLRRNQAKMVELGLASKSPRTIRFADSHRSKRKRNKRGNPSLIGRREDEQQHSVRRGMLLPPIDGWGESRAGSAVADTPTRQQEKINQLYDKYPHRHRQVRTLLGLLRPMMSAGSTTRDNTNCSIPPPIFAVGPSGTGKTSVVRDVLDALHCSEMASAYVNCAALDAPNLRAVTRPLLRQLQHHIHATVSATTTRPDNLSARANDDSNADSPTASEKQAKSIETDGGDEHGENQNAANGTTSSRATERAAANTVVVSSGDSLLESTPPRSAKPTPSNGRPASAAPSTSQSASSSQTTAAKFARDLGRLLLQRDRGLRGAVLVQDHAERLLTLPRVGSAEQPNYLAQLLFIPRFIGAPVTFLAITTSHLLQHSRINPLESTIAGTFQPICVRFQAYSTKGMLKDVLRRDHMRTLVTGSVLDAASPSLDFRRVAYDSFVDTLVQSLQMTTTNVKEISHVGQRLWPTYIEPLTSRESIHRTLQQARRNLAPSNPRPDQASMQREVLSILDQSIRPVLLATTGAGALGLLPLEQPQASSSNPYFELPLLAKYMLLSAYLCQINRPERDKDLFSIESNGKRRRTDADSQHQDPEEMGGAASAHPGNSLPRPRTFALERMLSVYASVVGLAASSSADDDRSRALGGAAFYDNLVHLCDIGLLHEHPSQSGYEITRLNDPRYWTSISADDAKSMAKSLSFPLDSYIL